MKKTFTILLISLLAFTKSDAQSLCINEIDYDQPGSDSAEFIELYNKGNTAINLGDYTVILFNGSLSSGGIYDSIPLPAQSLAPGAFFVICNSGGMVPNCNMVHGPATNMIQNGSPDAVALRDNNTLTVFGAVSYEGTCSSPYASGNGIPLAQSDTGNTAFVGISRYPDGNGTGDDSTDFHRACITPGAANVDTSTGCQPINVQNIFVKNAINIFPNPSKGIISISSINYLFNSCKVTVLNMLGNEMMTFQFTDLNKGDKSIDLSSLAKGVYLIRFRSEKSVNTQRIILKD